MGLKVLCIIELGTENKSLWFFRIFNIILAIPASYAAEPLKKFRAAPLSFCISNCVTLKRF